MKIYISIIPISFFLLLANYLEIKSEMQTIKNNHSNIFLQDQTTATLKSASRLFSDKNDLTSVLLIIPSGDTVRVLDYDDTFLHVLYEEYEGFIMTRHATLNKPQIKPSVTGVKDKPVSVSEIPRQVQQRQQVEGSRYSYLTNKYGPNVASRLYEGKIWKGMTAEMVKDSWGNPRKINRVISGNNTKEEWIYSNTWLYIQNDRLLEWGPLNK